jgi:uncharacterized membrane protein YgaE (UPF0421/DUF939 family)
MADRRPVTALVRRGEAILDDVAQRSRESLGTRLRRLGRTWLPIVQSAVAAGLAWFVATRFVGHPQPFFAPIAAVVSLGVSLGQRLRRSVELVVGVALGVLVAELLIGAIGRGAWQIGLVVLLAMAAAVLTGGGPLLVNQGAASAILVVALVPATSTATAAASRFIDALIGGAIGLLVNAILLPVNPIVVARRAAGRVLDELGSTLDDLASALATMDRSAAHAALARARHIEGSFEEFREALRAGREIARIAPVRWRARGHLTSYVDAVTDLDHAVRNTRVLARRVIVAIRDDEPVPPELVESVRRLADGVRTLRNELARGVEPRGARRGLIEAAELATSVVNSCGFSGKVVVAQVRSCVHDLLNASGLERTDVDEILAGIDDEG